MQKRRCIIGQSGGPTVAINATLAGVIDEAIGVGYEKVYGMVNGISGLLNKDIIELNNFKDHHQLQMLIHTPAMYLGSCRFQIPKDDHSLKQRIMDVLLEYQIDDFFYIGGNDSMDTIQKLDEYAKQIHCPIHFIGIPKTIDNDLKETDYTPGYPSACQFVATSLLEIAFDSIIYPMKSVVIVEIMGRDAGWLTAAAQLVNEVYPQTIDLTYMPENCFDADEFVEKVKEVLMTKEHCIVAVSEGLKDQNGMCISLDSGIQIDAFGHMSNHGCSHYLKKLIGDQLGCKTRAIQLSTLQRCSAHLASELDLKNAFCIGKHAVKFALENKTGIMVTIHYAQQAGFTIDYHSIQDIANHVKPFPKEWIDERQHTIKKAFIDYIVPLMYTNQEIELPRYIKRYEY